MLTKMYDYIHEIQPVKEEVWSAFKNLFIEINLKKGMYFAQDHEMSRHIGFLTHGIIRAFYRNEEGVEYNKHFFIENTFVAPYSALITQSTNLINLQAISDCTLLVANYKEITNLYAQYHDLESFGRKLAERFFVHKEQREVQIVMLDADKRYRIFQEEFPGLEQLIPQYYIASYLGITPTQLSRIRRKFFER